MAKTLPRDPDFFIESYHVRTGVIAGPERPSTRRRVLQLVITGRGWMSAAAPISVRVGEVPLMPIAIEREGRDLVCLLEPLPPEGALIVVEQWDRHAESPEGFTRRKLRGRRAASRRSRR